MEKVSTVEAKASSQEELEELEELESEIRGQEVEVMTEVSFGGVGPSAEKTQSLSNDGGLRENLLLQPVGSTATDEDSLTSTRFNTASSTIAEEESLRRRRSSVKKCYTVEGLLAEV